MVRQVLAFDEENPTPAHRLAYACAEDPAHAPPPTLRDRAARGGARRGDSAEVEPRGGAHRSEARGGVGVRGLSVAIIIPVLRASFYHS